MVTCPHCGHVFKLKTGGGGNRGAAKHRIDLVGKKFGRLTVLAYDRTEHVRHPASERHVAYWKCRCSCGNECSVMGRRLRTGATRSCGCLLHERLVRGPRRRKRMPLYAGDETLGSEFDD